MELDGKCVLVTGGAGFIGSHVCQHLQDRGATVHVLDNFFSGKPELVPSGAAVHEQDIRDDGLTPTLQSVDPQAIVHLAAIHYVPYCNENPEEAFDVNVMGTRQLLEAARGLSHLKKIVSTSTAAVYPAYERATSETDAVGPMDVYGQTKLVAEDFHELFAQETGVPTASIRLFNTYGTNETNPHLIPAILEQLEDGNRDIELGNLTPKRDFVHVRDVARGVVQLLTGFAGTHRAFNLGTGEAYSVRQVVEATSEALGEDIHVEQASDRIRESDRPHLQADISRMREEIGWEPEVQLVDGLAELLEAYGID